MKIKYITYPIIPHNVVFLFFPTIKLLSKILFMIAHLLLSNPVTLSDFFINTSLFIFFPPYSLINEYTDIFFIFLARNVPINIVLAIINTIIIINMKIGYLKLTLYAPTALNIIV